MEPYRTHGTIKNIVYCRTLTPTGKLPIEYPDREAVYVTDEVNGHALLYANGSGRVVCIQFAFGGHCKLIELAVNSLPEKLRQMAFEGGEV